MKWRWNRINMSLGTDKKGEELTSILRGWYDMESR